MYINALDANFIFPAYVFTTNIFTFLMFTDNVRLLVNTKGEFIERKGKKYLKLEENPKLDVQTTRLHIKLDNLFNGNKALGDTMNQFLNDNWVEIYDELKQGIFDALGTVFTNLLNNVFLRIPYDQMFKE